MDMLRGRVMRIWMAVVLAAAALGAAGEAHSQTINQTISQTMEGGMDIEITHPGEVIAGREASISVLVQNNGWEDKQAVSFEFSSQEEITVVPARLGIEKLSQGGSYGGSIDVLVARDADPGVSFLNMVYSQVLVANNEMPQPAIFHNTAIPLTVKKNPDVAIHVRAPESIFAAAEFPVEVEVSSRDMEMRDVSIRVIPPEGVGFRGETLHTFSSIKKGEPVSISSRIVTPDAEVTADHRLPFAIVVEYTDDIGEQKTDSETVSLVLRPRVFMELTTEGGIWLGGFFIAPYVSLGTIIGIPAGALLTLLVRRRADSSGKTAGKRRQ